MNAKDYLQDIAGVRVICYFVDDIYNLTELLKSQSDLIVIKERDYIGNPKPNGYRSYHVIVGVPVILSGWNGILPGGDTVSYYVHGFLGQYGASDFLQKRNAQIRNS